MWLIRRIKVRRSNSRRRRKRRRRNCRRKRIIKIIITITTLRTRSYSCSGIHLLFGLLISLFSVGWSPKAATGKYHHISGMQFKCSHHLLLWYSIFWCNDTMSVSYTHLDVYKRQALTTVMWSLTYTTSRYRTRFSLMMEVDGIAETSGFVENLSLIHILLYNSGTYAKNYLILFEFAAVIACHRKKIYTHTDRHIDTQTLFGKRLFFMFWV